MLALLAWPPNHTSTCSYSTYDKALVLPNLAVVKAQPLSLDKIAAVRCSAIIVTEIWWYLVKSVISLPVIYLNGPGCSSEAFMPLDIVFSSICRSLGWEVFLLRPPGCGFYPTLPTPVVREKFLIFDEQVLRKYFFHFSKVSLFYFFIL